MKPNWKNTIHNNKRKFTHISDIADTAYRMGYEHICWNDRIYKVYVEDGVLRSKDTGLTIDDMAVVKDEYDMKTVEVVVACHSQYESALISCKVEMDEFCTEENYHAEAIKQVEEQGFLGPFVCFSGKDLDDITIMAETLKSPYRGRN